MLPIDPYIVEYNELPLTYQTKIPLRISKVTVAAMAPRQRFCYLDLSIGEKPVNRDEDYEREHGGNQGAKPVPQEIAVNVGLTRYELHNLLQVAQKRCGGYGYEQKYSCPPPLGRCQ